jgi:hypothetical protein
MRPMNAYKDMLDNVVSPITCVSMNHQNQLEQMANGAMFATTRSFGPTDRSAGLLVGRTHLSGTAVSLVGGDPGVPMSHKPPSEV